MSLSRPTKKVLEANPRVISNENGSGHLYDSSKALKHENNIMQGEFF